MNSRELKALTSQLRGRREGERRNLPSLLTEYLSPPFTCFFSPMGFVVMPWVGGYSKNFILGGSTWGPTSCSLTYHYFLIEIREKRFPFCIPFIDMVPLSHTWSRAFHLFRTNVDALSNHYKTRKFSCLFHSHKMPLLAPLGPITDCNDQLIWIPYPHILQL